MKNRIIKSPAFRRYGYLVLVAVVALLIGYGVIDEGTGDLWKELIYALFGLGFLTAAVNTPDKDADVQPEAEEEDVIAIFDLED